MPPRPRYRERPAASGLGLDCVWTSTVRRDAAAPVTELVVPDGCVDLIWFAARRDLIVAGPDTGPQPAAIPPGERLAGVRFRPGTAAPVLGVPADAVRDARIALSELWGDEARRLADDLAAADAPESALAEYAARRVRTSPAPDPLARALAADLTEQPVPRAAARLGLSERQLRRRSVAAFGYPPKTLQRILRFQRALRLCRAGAAPAEAAYACGYADQAHLANEVRELAGVPLTGLLRLR